MGNNKEKHEFVGTVDWFNDNYGYGFISCEEVSPEKSIYVHFSHIMTDESFKTLSKGQYVTFQIIYFRISYTR